MKINGYVTKMGRWYVVHLPALDGSTQAKARRDILAMAEDFVVTLLPPPGAPVDMKVKASAQWTGDETFTVECSEPARLMALILHKQRRKAGLTLRDVADRMGGKSVNTYARFEQGVSVPTIVKLDQLFRAVGASGLVLF